MGAWKDEKKHPLLAFFTKQWKIWENVCKKLRDCANDKNDVLYGRLGKFNF